MSNPEANKTGGTALDTERGHYHFTPFIPDEKPDLPLSPTVRDLERECVEARPKVVMALSVTNFTEINEELAKIGLDASNVINIQFLYSRWKVYYRV